MQQQQFALNMSENAPVKRLPDPPGYTAPSLVNSSNSKSSSSKTPAPSSTQPDLTQLKLKKSWDVALSPAKSIPMNMFMMWMSGNSVQIFSILIVGMLLMNAVKGVLGVNKVFAPFTSQTTTTSSNTTDPFLKPKLTYLLMQLILLGLGLYKCSNMGLLPTSESDWLAFKTVRRMSEVSFAGLSQ